MKTEELYRQYLVSAGIVTDSRQVSENQIFFALKGENFDGNKYASDAVKKGARLAVVDDPRYEGDKTILVDDCLSELQYLASYHRHRMNVPVLAITGTNGKTTTKELTAAVLSKKYMVHYTRGNLNNHIGVPSTILSAPFDTSIMIIEMGANHPGEIKTLCDIADPGYGIITNIGTAHIEGFGSFEGVVRTKTELYEHLKKVNGVVIYNDKDPLLTEKATTIVKKAIPYSDPEGVKLEAEQDASGMNLIVKVTYGERKLRIQTNLFGSYNLWNVKAALAAGLFFGVDIEDAINAIQEYTPANNRSQIRRTANNVLICDSYNANPSSMHSALESFSRLEAKNKLVILGDMLELGSQSDEEHRKIIKLLESSGYKHALLSGKIFNKVYSGNHFRTFKDTNALREFLKSNPFSGYTILIKGSRGIGLEKIYDLL
jgi:UDP-N-acetylmuramoyl-tripeptide--D-alanyl-D-alanine ligase